MRDVDILLLGQSLDIGPLTTLRPDSLPVPIFAAPVRNPFGARCRTGSAEAVVPDPQMIAPKRTLDAS
jgi:hypothetical protein